MSYNITGVALSNVTAANITISGITVIGASAQDIADMIINHDKSLLDGESRDLGHYREIYGYVTFYVDEVRSKTSSLSDVTGIELIITFLNDYINFIKRVDYVGPLEIIEALSTLGMLHRAYGQYLQIRQATIVAFEVGPASLYYHRERLTANGADRKHFSKAETFIREAIKLCEEKLGQNHCQSVMLCNELGLLQRDRGEYKQACRTFQGNVTSLTKHHPSEKERFSEAYFNWAMAARDRRRHIAAAWLLWASRVFRDSAGRDLAAIRTVCRMQYRYAAAYLLIRAGLFAIFAISVGLIYKGLVYAFMMVVLFIVVYRVIFFVLDRFLLISLAVWFEGVEVASRWPKRSASKLLSDVMDRVVRWRTDVLNSGQ
jgi:hypothetical protein